MHVVINGWYAGASGAGSGQYVDHLLGVLAAQDHSICWTLLLPEAHTAQAQAGVTIVRRSLPRLPRQLQKVWWEQVTVPRVAQSLHADVLWVPYWAAPWWQPTPVVVTVHDLIPLLLPENRGGLPNRLYTRLVAMTARKSSRILTVSHASKRDIVTHLHVPESRVAAVWHGPNQEGASVPSAAEIDSVRTKYGLPARYFLYLGGFEARKNLLGILQGYATYLQKGGDAQVKLVIAGKLPGVESALTPDPRRMARESGVLEHVCFPGFIDEQDKAAVYAGATAFLFPSRYEGFGMMLLEAMQASAPVITSA